MGDSVVTVCYQKSFSTFLTNKLIPILSQPGFLRNVLQSSFPLSPT